MTTGQTLLDRYGLTLTIKDLSNVMHMKEKSIQNAISANRFPIRTVKTGKKRLATYRDVAAFLDESA